MSTISISIDGLRDTHDKFRKEMGKLLDEINPNLPLFIRFVFSLPLK